MTAASGTKKTTQARIQSVTEGAPSRALREIHRSPTTATMFMATTSQRVRDVMRPVTFLVIRARALRLAIEVVLHLLQRAFPAAIHDVEVALPARPFTLATLPHADHGLSAV